MSQAPKSMLGSQMRPTAKEFKPKSKLNAKAKPFVPKSIPSPAVAVAASSPAPAVAAPASAAPAAESTATAAAAPAVSAGSPAVAPRTIGNRPVQPRQTTTPTQAWVAGSKNKSSKADKEAPPTCEPAKFSYTVTEMETLMFRGKSVEPAFLVTKEKSESEQLEARLRSCLNTVTMDTITKICNKLLELPVRDTSTLRFIAVELIHKGQLEFQGLYAAVAKFLCENEFPLWEESKPSAVAFRDLLMETWDEEYRTGTTQQIRTDDEEYAAKLHDIMKTNHVQLGGELMAIGILPEEMMVRVLESLVEQAVAEDVTADARALLVDTVLSLVSAAGPTLDATDRATVSRALAQAEDAAKQCGDLRMVFKVKDMSTERRGGWKSRAAAVAVPKRSAPQPSAAARSQRPRADRRPRQQVTASGGWMMAKVDPRKGGARAVAVAAPGRAARGGKQQDDVDDDVAPASQGGFGALMMSDSESEEESEEDGEEDGEAEEQEEGAEEGAGEGAGEGAAAEAAGAEEDESVLDRRTDELLEELFEANNLSDAEAVVSAMRPSYFSRFIHRAICKAAEGRKEDLPQRTQRVGVLLASVAARGLLTGPVILSSIVTHTEALSDAAIDLPFLFTALGRALASAATHGVASITVESAADMLKGFKLVSTGVAAGFAASLKEAGDAEGSRAALADYMHTVGPTLGPRAAMMLNLKLKGVGLEPWTE